MLYKQNSVDVTHKKKTVAKVVRRQYRHKYAAVLWAESSVFDENQDEINLGHWNPNMVRRLGG